VHFVTDKSSILDLTHLSDDIGLIER